eukprot:gnl/Trimastix_PCT/918.p2 GENE.gnl/Trimastix_PCT/918~~gnl/Trimastix_PCT/918.p2  ORF type:complete len:413 (+),score=55.02 gnl/Trimastix_PCT/918:2086-3324(+)
MSKKEADPRKIFIGGVNFDSYSDSLETHFSKYGEVIDAIIMTEPHSTRSRGFGFVTFRDVASVDKVFEDTEPHVIDGRRVEVKRAVSREEMGNRRIRTKKVFVGGLDPETTNEEFKKHFESFGGCHEAIVMFDRRTGQPRGFGFVTYLDEEVAEEVVTKTHIVHGKQVDVKKAEGRVRDFEGPPPRRDDRYRDDRRGPPPRYEDRYRGPDRHFDRYDRYDDRYGPPPRDHYDAPPRDYPPQDYYAQDSYGQGPYDPRAAPSPPTDPRQAPRAAYAVPAQQYGVQAQIVPAAAPAQITLDPATLAALGYAPVAAPTVAAVRVPYQAAPQGYQGYQYVAAAPQGVVAQPVQMGASQAPMGQVSQVGQMGQPQAPTAQAQSVQAQEVAAQQGGYTNAYTEFRDQRGDRGYHPYRK